MSGDYTSNALKNHTSPDHQKFVVGEGSGGNHHVLDVNLNRSCNCWNWNVGYNDLCRFPHGYLEKRERERSRIIHALSAFSTKYCQ